jgi:hypothetical protein
LATVAETVEFITSSETWDERVSRIRQIPARHGTNDLAGIHAQIARALYVPHLAPDFAYVPDIGFYGLSHFEESYALASAHTDCFADVSVERLTEVLSQHPKALLAFRTITGLTRTEFAAASRLVVGIIGGEVISPSKVDSMERRGTATSEVQATVLAETVRRIMDRSLFGAAPVKWRVKQDKPDTTDDWTTVRDFATNRVPYSVLLHQRHYGGAWRQVLDATSETRGDIIEDAVEALFQDLGVPYIRTGSHNQADIAARFGLTVTPAPDFVVYDASGTLRALLECKGANDGGTARDKALRFERLRSEANRLGGVPLLAVLGGLGWTRVNDTLGPVVRDCDGRVFSVSNVGEMAAVAPFPSLVGLGTTSDADE